MDNRYAVVIGAVNLDIWGQSFAPLIPRDSNPGSIKLSAGGVGRNIANNLSLMGVRVEMLTALGSDGWARQLARECADAGIGLGRSVHVAGARTSTYICLSGPDGDLAMGLSDTDITKYITPEYIEKNLDLLSRAQLVVFDGNLTEEAMDCLTEKCPAPLFVDPVSVTKAKKLFPFLSRIHTIKPNSLEAEALTGISDPEGAAQELVYLGVKRAFVSDGANGMFAAHGLDSYHIPTYETRLVNATGGGDATMAGLCRSFMDALDIESSARYALAAGSLAVECEDTINPALSHSEIMKRMTEGKIYIK